MRTKVERWGSSLVPRIPRIFAAEVGLLQGAVVELQLAGSGLSIAPVPIMSPSLDALLEQIRPENLHVEIDAGNRMGNEAW